MKAKFLMAAAFALAVTPPLFAAPGTGNNAPTVNQTNGPSVTTGQPGADCEALVESGDGSTPGNSASAPGSAFNPDGNAGKHYAGEQPQNSRNSASVSQYDVGCFHGTRAPQ